MKTVFCILNQQSGRFLGKSGWTARPFARRFATLQGASSVSDSLIADMPHLMSLLAVEPREVADTISAE